LKFEKTMKITSVETLDAAAGEHARRKIALDQAIAEMNAEIADAKKRHQVKISKLVDDCAEVETEIREWLECHAEILGEKKSRETPMSTFGFRMSTRLETANRKITWADVVDRLQKYDWGHTYLSQKNPSVNKEAIHADRAILDEAKLLRAGVRFVTENEFWITPKIEQPAASVAS
jgi:phage host-nuclease inhibitor protein Gam